MKEPENDPITVSTHLLSSLSSEIPLIQNFKGKWALIRAKLTDLEAQLTDFSHFPATASNPLALDLILSVSATVNDAVSLARRCQSPSLTDGKLRTQSDVDSLLAKLDFHLRDSEILFKSGVLHDTAGFSSSSTRETVRARCRDLLTRLQIGNPSSRAAAMDSLLLLLQEDDKNVMIAVAHGIVPVLVRLLDSGCFETKEKAVHAISMVSVVDSSNDVLAAEGLLLLNHLLRVLDSGSGFAKEKACLVLQALSSSKDNARAIGSRGGVSSLLDICQGGTPGSQAYAAGVLRNLAAFAENKENFVEENGVGVLLGVASSGTALAQQNAIGCLCHLVSGSDSQKLVVVREGGIECLKNFWDSGWNTGSLEVAVELLMHLASCSPIAEVVVSQGFVTRLVGVLSCGVSGVRIQAARAVYELGHCSRARKEMGESGCIAPLIKMLDGKAVEEKEAAAKALSSLILFAANRKIFKKLEGGIVSSVQLLDPSIQNLDHKYPVAVLASLVQSKKCKKQMVAAGACLHLQKLVAMEVEGSKKLLESLGPGKIWGVFARP